MSRKKLKYSKLWNDFITDPEYIRVHEKGLQEVSKTPTRTEIINFLLSINKNETHYLEIGVRNPDHNYNHINANQKYSVDPGVEFKENPVDFKMTSDTFFEKMGKNEILSKDYKFDIIFIDGLHLAYQVDRDIKNALQYIKDDGFIVLHDCNPPTEWHARESYEYFNTPAKDAWNGTGWKAFLKWRFSSAVNSCCIDTDWGVGILSKTQTIGNNIEETNIFYEYKTLENNREKHLNLITFSALKDLLS